MMVDPQTVSLSMSGLTAIGGVMGFMKKKSFPSLIAGLGLGGAYYYSSTLLSPVSSSTHTGNQIATFSSVLLFGSMLHRYQTTRKVWPAGIMMVLGGCCTAFYLGQVVQ